ncbi:MAG: CoA transferase [Dehalococcoidales bacterium]|nr:CoA transferase [Dehalococcoidales bacterium]
MTKSKAALQDVRVIEYGQLISVPYCGKLFADLGAEVIKIEKPVLGDDARRREPFLDDLPGSERSGLFLNLNTNKLGITLNLEKATGREIFKKLIRNADILIEDTSPGEMSSLGLDYDSLKSINQTLIVTSITPFGQTGPYQKYEGCDLTGWHMGGAGYITPRYAGTTDQEPLRVMQLTSYLAGINAAAAAMCALQVQRRTGNGQRVDVSHLECMFLALGLYAPYWSYAHRNATRAARAVYAPIHFLKCKDGWVFIQGQEEHHWRRLVEMMGNPDWAQTGLFDDMASRGDNWDSLQPLLEEWTGQYTKAEIFEMAKEKKMPIGPVNTIEEVVHSRQLKERGFFKEIEHPGTGKMTYPGAPYQFAATPWAIRTPAPLLGQHNEEIYCTRLGFTKGELAKMYETGII